MACASDTAARRAAVVFTITQILVRSLLWLLIAVALLVIYPFDPTRAATDGFVAGRELTFATGIDALLPVGARGLMLTAMLAALASTVDTHLNWGASYWSNDLYKALWAERIRGRVPRPAELVRVARLSNMLIIAIALAITANLGSIQQGWQLSLLFGAGVGAVLVLRWLWERVNLYSEVGAIVVSLLLAPLLLATVEAEWLRLATMAGVSTLVVIAAALWLPGTDPAKLARFYARVRPPGWWPESAERAGAPRTEAPAAFARGAAAIAACAMSLFAWLVGFGQLLLQTAEPLMAFGLIGLGAVAVPVWWRALAHPRGPEGVPGGEVESERADQISIQ
jgi:Na+/proline symporter